jgi:hypothetical protein
VVIREPWWHDLEIADLSTGFRPIMRLDVTDDDIDAALLQTTPFIQHRVGLPHARAGSEIDLQFPGLLLADDREEIISAGARSRVDLGHARGLFFWGHRVERQVEFEHVDSRFAEDAELAARCRFVDLAFHRVIAEAAFPRDAGRLQ